MTPSTPAVSIVVPTFNRWASLERLLRALEEQTYPSDRFEVLVVDDGSTDGTPEKLRKLASKYALRVLEQTHQGPAAARNLGVAHAAGGLVVFLDDDVVPVRDLIHVHVATHESHHAAALVVIGPMSPPRDAPRSAWVRWEEDKLERQYSAMQSGQWGCTWRQFYTANSSVRRALFTRSGGFDVAFKRAEDVELGYRLRDLGAQFVFTREADVLHYASRTFRAWCSAPYQYGRYDVIMSREKGHEALTLAFAEFRWRHPASQALARLLTGRRLLTRAVLAACGVAARGAGRCGMHRGASPLLSVIFNVLYWQGVCDELGGREVLWRTAAASSR